MSRGPGRTRALPAQSRGAVLITVVFVMLVLGLLAAALARSLEGQYAGESLTHLARQAQYAALSGIEWGRGRAVQNGICANGQIAVGEFTIVVACTSETVTEGMSSYEVFDIDAEARRGVYGEIGFARRWQHARASNR